MFEADFDEFAQMLDDVHELREIPAASIRAKALFFRQVQAYPLHIVQGAIDAHLADPVEGKYRVPLQPAHITAQIESALSDDGRPAADEAWSIALTMRDEQASGRITPEILAAFDVCRPVLELGDKTGARMAFKDAYARIVLEARRAGRPTEWLLSLGRNAERRAEAAQDALLAGHLRLDQAQPLMLAGPQVIDRPTKVGEMALKAIRDAAAKMAHPTDIAMARNAKERDRLDALKSQSEERVRAYQAQQG